MYKMFIKTFIQKTFNRKTKKRLLEICLMFLENCLSLLFEPRIYLTHKWTLDDLLN